MAVKVDFIHQDNIIRHYVCANCWGDLHKDRTEERVLKNEWVYEMLDCETEGCPCQGFVSRTHMENTEVIARMERYNAWRDLKDAVPWVREKGWNPLYEGRWDPEKETVIRTEEEKLFHRSTQTILDELGF